MNQTHRDKMLDAVKKINPKMILEVGVHNGNGAEVLLKVLNPENLVLIDCWEPQKEYESKENYITYLNTGYFEDCYQRVIEKFRNDSRVDIIKKYSLDASKMYEDETFDFIYVDACHRYECVMDDLNCWFPKLKVGGIIGGDDYCDEEKGVVNAVNDFFSNKYKIELFEGNKRGSVMMDGSWLVRKSE